MTGTPSRTILVLLLTGLCACSDWFDDDDSGRSTPSVATSHFGVASNVRCVIRGPWLVFLASEATTGAIGTDLNGDGDFDDSIATVVDLRTSVERGLAVAAVRAAAVGDEIFFAVDEDQDGRDWSLDGVADDLALLHWNETFDALTFVSTLNPVGEEPFFEVGDRLYFCDVPPPGLVAPNTALSFVTQAAPQTPVRVLNADIANALRPALHALDEGLVFLSVNESIENSDLNGDGDLVDEFVLALFDTTIPGGLVRVVGHAMASEKAPVRGLAIGPNDWIVGFLVNEDAEGETNLNDPTLFLPEWQPPQCVGAEDTDTDDDVLYFLRHAAWVLNPVGNPPVNTGLVGRDRVVAVLTSPPSPGYVGTISAEDDEGTCELNEDDDTDDRVVRWVLAAPPARPFTDSDEIVAIADVPGGTRGATDFASRFVCAVDEAADGRDHDGFEDEDVVILAKLDPSAFVPHWVYDQSISSDLFVGPTWMQKSLDGDRLLVAMSEAVLRLPLNSEDSDLLDSVPVFGTADLLVPGDIDFPGPPVAIVADDAGIEIGGEIGLFRVSEQADFRDWNEDGDLGDVVLLTTRLDDLDRVTLLATLMNNQAGDTPPLAAIAGGNAGDVGAAFVAGEAGLDSDFNGDGDQDDFVVRWFRFDELP